MDTWAEESGTAGDGTGHRLTLEVRPGAEGGGILIGLRGRDGEEDVTLSRTPAAVRELAAALVRAADEAERVRSADPVTVEARELRRGDVRDGERVMTVERVRVDGDDAHITWVSNGGRTWTQSYAADAGIGLRRRG
ncbi:hypothetical protein PZB75_01525 [Streptomyces sp. AM 4-1-1]|uniref:hypothetical protein n=1 Tax=unclassified Streptomyces TaxID=2593676 RepID=UPI0023B9FE0A|nr:hypothetical protein [Streptomyces sp. AM 4-1-1]WEH32170.1 hypothetical protein PZB75_01525 [Streptomyces sp. AM 4-1-1]